MVTPTREEIDKKANELCRVTIPSALYDGGFSKQDVEVAVTGLSKRGQILQGLAINDDQQECLNGITVMIEQFNKECYPGRLDRGLDPKRINDASCKGVLKSMILYREIPSKQELEQSIRGRQGSSSDCQSKSGGGQTAPTGKDSEEELSMDWLYVTDDEGRNVRTGSGASGSAGKSSGNFDQKV